MVKDKQRIREYVWRLLEEKGVALFPNWNRIPNFKGAEITAKRLSETKLWKNSKIIFCSPDSPQRPIRELALRENKILIMATPKLRQGFLVIYPENVKGKEKEAATIKGAFRYGKIVRWNPPKPDLIVVGSVAVDIYGNRIGKGGGFGDREIKFFKEKFGEIPVVTNVHDLQVFEKELPRDPWDEKIDIIVTPTRIIVCNEKWRDLI